MTARPTSTTSVTRKAPARSLAGRQADAATTRNPRQEVQHAHLHAFYLEGGETENHESSALAGHTVVAGGRQAFGATLGGDAVQVDGDTSTIAADIRAAARPWGGSYCSYQLGTGGPFWVMPALGSSRTSSTGASAGPRARRGRTPGSAAPST